MFVLKAPHHRACWTVLDATLGHRLPTVISEAEGIELGLHSREATSNAGGANGLPRDAR